MFAKVDKPLKGGVIVRPKLAEGAAGVGVGVTGVAAVDLPPAPQATSSEVINAAANN